MPNETKHKLTELLVCCPICGRTGFTITGLQLHYCPENRDAAGRKTRLSHWQWQETVAAAQMESLEGAGAV